MVAPADDSTSKETDLNYSMCAQALVSPDQVLVVPDLAADPRTSATPFVTGEPYTTLILDQTSASEHLRRHALRLKWVDSGHSMITRDQGAASHDRSTR